MAAHLNTFMVHHGLSAVFVLMTLESICIPIPSELVMPFAGYLSNSGQLALIPVILVATIANLVGGWIAYLIGQWGGRPFVLKWGRYILLHQAHLERAEAWFHRYGSPSVCIGRLLPGVRTFISLPAGMGRMPLGKFFIFSAVGSLVWNTALTLFGYQLGKHWELVDSYLKPLSVIGVLVLVASVLWFWFGRNRVSQRESRHFRRSK